MDKFYAIALALVLAGCATSYTYAPPPPPATNALQAIMPPVRMMTTEEAAAVRQAQFVNVTLPSTTIVEFGIQCSMRNGWPGSLTQPPTNFAYSNWNLIVSSNIKVWSVQATYPADGLMRVIRETNTNAVWPTKYYRLQLVTH